MEHPSPQIRYYDARPRRRLLGPVLAVVLLLGALAVGVAVGARWWEGRTAATEVAVLEPRLPAGAPQLQPVADDTGEPVDSVDFGDTDAAHVAIIGDSITNGSRNELEYVLAAQGVEQVTIDAEDGRRIELGDGTGSPLSGQRALYALLADGVQPDVWVVALGTNDAGQYAAEADYARLVQLIIDMLPDDVPLVWVDAYRGDQTEGSQQFDDALRSTLAGRSSTVVVPWSSIASDPAQTVLRGDDVHPNAEGRVVFATVVAQGVAQVS